MLYYSVNKLHDSHISGIPAIEILKGVNHVTYYKSSVTLSLCNDHKFAE
jgi:hypothetical protein